MRAAIWWNQHGRAQPDLRGPEGIGFAIPVNLVRGVMEQVLAHGHVVRGCSASSRRTCPGAGRAARHRRRRVTVVNILVRSPASTQASGR